MGCSADTKPAPRTVAKLTGRQIDSGASRMLRVVLVGGLLIALVPGAWGAGGSGQPPEPATPESCVHSPTAQCVIRLSLAAVEEIAGADSRAEALAYIAVAQANAGEAGEAREILSRALVAAAGIDAAAYAGESWKTSPEEEVLGEQARIFSLIARVQADTGDTEGARETFSRAAAAAGGIEYDPDRSNALFEVAMMQIAAGALPEARLILARANLAYNWHWLGRIEIQDLVRAQAEAGDVVGALVTARSIPDDGVRELALANVVAVQAEAGDESGALVTAGEIEDSYFRAQAMSDIGIARAKRGDFVGAWVAVWKIRGDIWRDALWKHDMGPRDMEIIVGAMVDAIVKAHLAKGEFERAFTAARVEEEGDRLAHTRTFVAIAKARIAVGHFDAARGIAEGLCYDPDDGSHLYCVEVLADLAAALAAAGRTDESREVASTALDEANRYFISDRPAAFTAAYTALMRAGDVEAARRAFSSALAAATPEENEGVDYREAEESFVRMGAAAAREGDSDSAARALSGALAASDAIEYLDERVQMLVRTGLAWTRAGNADIARAMFSRAVATATYPETAFWRAKALAEIAFALASGRWPAADGHSGFFR